MRANKFEILSVVLGICVAAQVACNRLTSSADPEPTASPDQSALVDEILKRYTEAVGGKDAIDGIKSYKVQGRFESSVLSGTFGTFEVWGKEPHKTLSVIEFPRIGTLRKGFDGESRWVQTPVGTFSDESPKQMAEVERDAEVYRAGKIRALYQSMRLEGSARLKRRDVYVVEGIPEKGPTEKLFFDKETGLLMRWDMVRRNPERGNIFVKVHLDDYRQVGGVQVPFNTRFAFESFDFTLKVDQLEHNLPIDDAMFKKPR